MLAGFSSPAFADITHRMSSSLQLQTNAAATQVSRIGSTYSVSGTGVSTDVGGGGSADLNVGGLGTLTDGVGQGSIATATHTAGTAYTVLALARTATPATIAHILFISHLIYY